MSDLRPQSWMWRHMIVICLLMRFELKRNITEYTGFWGPSTSSVDWCESNYEMTEYMAEFNNSLSSFSMVLSGLLGLMMHPWAEKRFKLAFITTIILGIGSVAFHGTLHRFSQALDEVPMLYCVMTYTFIAICQRYPISGVKRLILGLSLILYCALLTILVTVSHGTLQFTLFHISFNSAHLFALFQAYRLYTDRCSSHKTRNTKKIDPSLLLFERGALFYVSSFICWLADMFLCEYINPHYSTSYLPFNPQLHAWWHIFISIGLYCMGVLTLYERMEKKKGHGSSTIEYRWMILPYVAMSDRALCSPLLTRQRAKENKLLF